MNKINKSRIWNLAKKNIAGENMLLSKHPNQFLGNDWPSYFSKTKDINVWDLSGKKYKDFSIMGIGTNSLGYSNPKIDNKIINSIKKGNMSTFNCAEEVLLSEKLLQMNKWANKVRFTRSGGEANAVAIRLARAATGKSKIALCGYHGWHDWYLSANHNSKKNLDNLLLPDLKIKGVPRELKNTVYPFKFNDIPALKKILAENNLAAIKIEVQRNTFPESKFLKFLRDTCSKKNIVLIFDECTSGFRETYGGVFSKFNVNPDMTIFGKALGNGYAINAIVGIDSVMDSINQSFISSTFWTERIGFVAANATLDEMKKIESWKKISELGVYYSNTLKKLALLHNLEIEISGLKPIINIHYKNHNDALAKTFLMREMLNLGYLYNNLTYISTKHTKKEINRYASILDDNFKKLSKLENKDLKKINKNFLSKSTFRRIN